MNERLSACLYMRSTSGVELRLPVWIRWVLWLYAAERDDQAKPTPTASQLFRPERHCTRKSKISADETSRVR